MKYALAVLVVLLGSISALAHPGHDCPPTQGTEKQNCGKHGGH